MLFRSSRRWVADTALKQGMLIYLPYDKSPANMNTCMVSFACPELSCKCLGVTSVLSVE